MSDTTADAYSWAKLFANRTHFFRLMVFCSFVFVLSGILVIGTFFLFTYALRPEAIRLEPNGALTISGIGRPTRYILVLPASQRWFDTNIFLKRGQRAHIETSGRIHLSIAGVVDAANTGRTSVHSDWNGPNGLPKPVRPIDVSHQAMWISPDAPLGSVLAYVSPNTDPHATAHPHGIVSIKADGWAQGEGKLWLTVNDMVLDNTDENRRAYVATPEILRETKDMEDAGKSIWWLGKRWHHFIQDRRFDAFFDDNLGEFLVQITVEE